MKTNAHQHSPGSVCWHFGAPRGAVPHSQALCTARCCWVGLMAFYFIFFYFALIRKQEMNLAVNLRRSACPQLSG